ncbi:MAG: ATP--guanido phosphotransferase [Clostridia bacterium]|nr:ATP--guanido phosphotransferase [Clostridia bacterium]
MNDVVISSRVRLARNLADYPFPNRSSIQQKKEICDKVRQAFCDNKNFGIAHFSSLNLQMRTALVEKHLVSREFAVSADGKELITGSNLSIMINEEDVFRIQSILPGFCLDKAYENVNLADDFIDEKFMFAFDASLGYLTACPTNLGCALRASVMVHLPGLAKSDGLESLVTSLSGLGYTVRGMYGEGSNTGGFIYQISNMRSMGKTENEIIQDLKKITEKIVDSEHKARKNIHEKYPIRTEDKILRSHAIAKSAKILSEKEFFDILTDLSVGITCGIIKDISPEKLYGTLNTLLSAIIMADNSHITDGFERRIYRAEKIKEIFED